MEEQLKGELEGKSKDKRTRKAERRRRQRRFATQGRVHISSVIVYDRQAVAVSAKVMAEVAAAAAVVMAEVVSVAAEVGSMVSKGGRRDRSQGCD